MKKNIFDKKHLTVNKMKPTKLGIGTFKISDPNIFKQRYLNTSYFQFNLA